MAPFNSKAKQWTEGRRHWASELKSWRTAHEGPLVWMHCASLGEFEQGRPVLETVRAEFPEVKILLTFFSPSGYEIRKNYNGADKVMYLPMDGKENAEKFLDIVHPELVLWVKYEYWYFYLKAIAQRKIPLILFSAKFRAGQQFFKKRNTFWKSILASFSKIFVQDEDSASLLKQIGFREKVAVAGDTRFDRVAAIAAEAGQVKHITEFVAGRKCFVAGSTWEDDEMELAHFIRNNPGICFIIAPHVISATHLKELKERFPGAILYSQLPSSTPSNVLIIDNIGMLSKLYAYADVTYVGGGFNDSGIHNTLEAAVYGKPVFFGPNYQKFAEAVGLINCGAALSYKLPTELEAGLVKVFSDELLRLKMSGAAEKFVQENCGATEIIMQDVRTHLLKLSKEI